MTVNSKFDIGDDVWFIANNVVNTKKITGVFFELYEDGNHSGCDVKYILGFDSSEKVKGECRLFSSKKELLESL